MEKLSLEKISGNLKLTLKDNTELVGSIPCDSLDNIHIIFLPEKNREEFYKRVKPDTFTKFDDIKDLVRVIPRDFIKSYNIITFTLKGIVTENNKPIPKNLELFIENNGRQGYLNIKYKIPNHNKIFELGDIKIENGLIKLPLTLVFLSYAKEDKKLVEFVMNSLHNKGVTTWYDKKDLLPGDHWEDKILNGIEKSDYVFVFLSSNTMNRSGYKNKELRYILEQYSLKPLGKKYIIPLLLDECNPPRELKQIQWLKVSDEDWIQKLLEAIGK